MGIELISVNNKSQAYTSESIDGITEYPTKAGVFRHIDASISKLPSEISGYGTLIIFYSGYYFHLYHDTVNDTLYFGSGDVGETIRWKKIVTY